MTEYQSYLLGFKEEFHFSTSIKDVEPSSSEFADDRSKCCTKVVIYHLSKYLNGGMNCNQQKNAKNAIIFTVI